MQVPPADRTAATRMLNDRLRTTWVGGQTKLSAGVAALPSSVCAAVLTAVLAFDRFTADNDPYDEHDCAALTVGSERIIWKIDYYDQSLSAHSPDPSDPAVTCRVLTVMLAEEY